MESKQSIHDYKSYLTSKNLIAVAIIIFLLVILFSLYMYYDQLRSYYEDREKIFKDLIEKYKNSNNKVKEEFNLDLEKQKTFQGQQIKKNETKENKTKENDIVQNDRDKIDDNIFIKKLDFIPNLDEFVKDGYTVQKSFAKKGSKLEETFVKTPYLYYFPGHWEIEHGWLIRDLGSDKYYVPEGLIYLEKGVKFEWEPLKIKSDSEIEFFIIYK